MLAFREVAKEGLAAAGFARLTQRFFSACVGNGSTNNNVLVCCNKIEEFTQIGFTGIELFFS